MNEFFDEIVLGSKDTLKDNLMKSAHNVGIDLAKDWYFSTFTLWLLDRYDKDALKDEDCDIVKEAEEFLPVAREKFQENVILKINNFLEDGMGEAEHGALQALDAVKKIHETEMDAEGFVGDFIKMTIEFVKKEGK